jgi:fructose-1,6-bisphosphatase/inositol monophosphatase family enzyme
MEVILPGKVNGHLVGIAMKEAVRRATEVVRTKRHTFEASEKVSAYKSEEDFVTDADIAAQEVYLRILTECFHGYGIVGEENNLSLQPSEECKAFWFTVDPLDGTKAYMRRQSQGIGTMLALMQDETVIAAFVGDIMTEEMYGFRPGSKRVFRISSLKHFEELAVSPKSLSDQYLLLRDHPNIHSSLFQKMSEVKTGTPNTLFKNIEIAGGSIGLGMARLWKGEVGAVALRPGHQTPWDLCPVVGITLQLGFVFLKPNEEEPGFFKQYNPPISKEIYHQEHETLIIHSSRLPELEEWSQRNFS